MDHYKVADLTTDSGKLSYFRNTFLWKEGLNQWDTGHGLSIKSPESTTVVNLGSLFVLIGSRNGQYFEDNWL